MLFDISIIFVSCLVHCGLQEVINYQECLQTEAKAQREGDFLPLYGLIIHKRNKLTLHLFLESKRK